MTRLPRALDELRGLRAARWLRESTGRQLDRFGPEAQREQQDLAITRHGLVDTGLAWSVAHSGRTVGRSTQFAEMLEAAGRDYDVLVVGYVSRFARDLETAVNARSALHRSGAAILFADDRILSSDEDAWEQWAREAVEAEAYSRRLGRRIREGYAAKARQLRDQAGRPPYGFRRAGDRHTLQPDPDRLAAAVNAWRLSASGRSDAAIAGELGLTLWTVRGILRSTLFVGRLPDGRETPFAPSIDQATYEQALAHRRRRVRTNARIRMRTYPLTGSGPMVCAECGLPAKGAAKRQRDGSWLTVYRHASDRPCPGWQVKEVPAELLEDQVAQLLDGAKPNRESTARIRMALAAPVKTPDRLAIARVDARLRALAAELVAPEQLRSSRHVLEEIEGLRAERTRLEATPADVDEVRPDEALEWLANLGTLWRDTDDEGRRALAVGAFARLGVISGPERRSHRIVDVEATEAAERRGLALALPTRIVVTVVGDTGPSAARVTTSRIRIAHRREWLMHIRRRSA